MGMWGQKLVQAGRLKRGGGMGIRGRVPSTIRWQGWKRAKSDQAGPKQANKGSRAEKAKLELNEVGETTMRWMTVPSQGTR